MAHNLLFLTSETDKKYTPLHPSKKPTTQNTDRALKARTLKYKALLQSYTD